MPIDKETIGFLIVGGLALAVILLLVRLPRERNTCPSCGKASGSMYRRTRQGEIVNCESCGSKWRRMPISGYEGELPHKVNQPEVGKRVANNNEGTENWFPKYLFWTATGIAFFVLLDCLDADIPRLLPTGLRVP